ncbi:MAG: lamin tail domain-containing protein [Verrucomicrobia bacterium]|nr:lamin tail domain-containing protein [Verrucomicrobiota bacterium]
MRTHANLVGLLLTVGVCLPTVQPRAQIVTSEIMYHPVEEPDFNADGSPALDLYEDVHEFLEIHNVGRKSVELAGWKIVGGIQYTFPPGAAILPGSYRVIAKNPARLSAVPAYGLALADLFGPYTNQLSNAQDAVRLQDAEGKLIDAVSYSAEFPWAMSADGLGANEDFTGLNRRDYQYRGRSLERVSYTHPANDPANWLASPLPGNPSPGQSNAVSRAIPKPVVVRSNVTQNSDEAPIIRNNQPVRIDCAFSATNSLSRVSVEWFVENVNATNEARTATPMSVEGPPGLGQFKAVLPGQPNRTIVRFRFRADRGADDEAVSPRADDPFQWHAYFVSPVRTSSRPVYDCFIASNSLTILERNITQSPRRVTTPDPPGRPRASWNATEPAIMVHDGVVYDIRMRHHGSRYNRRANRYSLKWQFPRYKKFNGVTGIFETDKGNDFIVGHNLFIEAGFPVSKVRYVDLYLNNLGVMPRLEQGEFDGEMLDAYHETQRRLNPGAPLEPTGEIYKCVGTIDMPGEGPYGRGDGRKLVKPGFWTDLQMYDWTFALQNHNWRGSYYFQQMIDALWTARGDTPAALNPNIPALRAYFTNFFDIDEMLDYLAIENWCCPWDDTTQNHFFWQRRNGKWGLLPWDSDFWFGRGDNTPASASIYIGEVGDRNNNFRGPNFFKDSFLKAFRQEYKQRLYVLNNTFLHPENISAMGFGSIRSFANARFAAVNNQCGFGPFQRPAKPTNLNPSRSAAALPPAKFQASPYAHSATPATSHAKTLWEIRRASGTYQAPIWKLASATNLTEIEIPFNELAFGETYYWRCTYFDSDHHPSLTSDETPFHFGPEATIPSDSGDLVLNEIAARNRGSVNNAGQTPDWIELFNQSSRTIDLGGMSLSDDMTVPDKYTFPLNTRITAQGYLTVWCDDATNAPGLHTGFGLNDRGQTVALFGLAAGGQIVSDFVVFGQQIADLTIGRVPDGAGPWQLTAPSPAQPNRVTLLDSTANLKINEWMASPNSGDDWFELFNPDPRPVALEGLYLTDHLSVRTNTRIAGLSFIAPGGFLKFVADEHPDQGPNHVGFRLSASGESIYLISTNRIRVLDSITFGPQAGGVSQGRLPDGGATIVSFVESASPEERNYLPATPEDRDNDGIPDSWEMQHGLSVGLDDAALDPDNDGMTNLQEYIAGTDPKNSASVLKLEASRAGSEVLFRFSAQADKAYSLLFRTNLTLGAWLLQTNIAAQPGSRTIQVAEPVGTFNATRYYRLTTPPVPSP